MPVKRTHALVVYETFPVSSMYSLRTLLTLHQSFLVMDDFTLQVALEELERLPSVIQVLRAIVCVNGG